LHDAADVAGPFAATADGLYKRDSQLGTVGPAENWVPVRSGAHGVVASDGASDGGRVHTADSDTLYELTDDSGASPDPHWQPCDLPVRERVVDVTYGQDTYAITEDGTFLVDTADDATADGRGGWRARSLGVPEVVGIAVA